MTDAWILKDREPVPVELMEWAHWFERATKDGSRIIKKTGDGDVRVSTVFIGLHEDLFETMIFNGPHDQYQERCETYDEALSQHEKACSIAFPSTSNGDPT
jgi:hypothetical protein